jgi:probable lipoprotein (TIGR04455 family)
LFVSACGSTVKNVRLRDDYQTVDRTATVRLAVVTSPLPAGNEAVGRMWSKIARRYANHHRDFIARTETASASVSKELCGAGIQGVLHLEPRVEPVSGGAVEAEVHARIFRCWDGEEVWSVEAGGSWPSEDPQVVELIAEYVEAYGEEVRPYVAPSFHLLRATLDELPRPDLDDDSIVEKIELGE